MSKVKALTLWLMLYAAVALGAARFLERGHWVEMRPGLVAALSLLCATVLVRLAKGFPVTDAESFESVEEIDQLKALVTRSATHLTWMLGLGVVAVISAISMPHMLGGLDHLQAFSWFAPAVPAMKAGLSAIAAVIMTMALSRLVPLVRLDRHLLEVHADAVKTSWRRKRDKARIDQGQKAKGAFAKMKTGDSYAGRLPPPEIPSSGQ